VVGPALLRPASNPNLGQSHCDPACTRLEVGGGCRLLGLLDVGIPPPLQAAEMAISDASMARRGTGCIVPHLPT
jgi:hypothetical protein